MGNTTMGESENDTVEVKFDGPTPARLFEMAKAWWNLKRPRGSDWPWSQRDYHDILRQQDEYEAEGARAALQGKTRDECPYDPDREKTAWSFWVHGNGNARHEIEILERGTIHMMKLDLDAQLETPPRYKTIAEWSECVEQAYRSGTWRPRWITVPKEWGPPPDRFDPGT